MSVGKCELYLIFYKVTLDEFNLVFHDFVSLPLKNLHRWFPFNWSFTNNDYLCFLGNFFYRTSNVQGTLHSFLTWNGGESYEASIPCVACSGSELYKQLGTGRGHRGTIHHNFTPWICTRLFFVTLDFSVFWKCVSVLWELGSYYR